jgi:RNA polymerase sigma-70 factor (ECF subfamily)
MEQGGAGGDLVSVVSAARAAWPEIAFDEAAFVAFLAARPAGPAGLRASGAADLLLAFACAEGDAAALRIVEREYLARPAALLPARYRHDAPEILQALRARVLVPSEGRPARIAGYSGRGSLRGWLRVAATRIAADLARSREREVSLDEDGVLADRAGGDLEIDDLKRRYRDEFRAAFSAAILDLDARARTILRQHYVDGLTMEGIGSIHRVHRMTVLRWMHAAREALARETRRELRVRLRVDPRELDSILRLIDSHLDVSIRTFLGPDAGSR